MAESDKPSLDCHVSGEAMRLVHVVPKFGPHHELRSFKCDDRAAAAPRVGGREQGESGGRP